MDVSYLIKVVTLIIAVSAATERAVEILKGALASIPGFAFGVWLSKQDPDETGETRRQLILHVLAAVFGVVTAYLAKAAIEGALTTTNAPVNDGNVCGWIWLIGICSSGGSSFWNSILSYLTKAKDIKAEDAAQAKAQTKHLRKTLEDISANPAFGEEVQASAAAAAKRMPGT